MLEISAILVPADDDEEEESVRGQWDNGAMTGRPFYQCIRVMKSQRKKINLSMSDSFRSLKKAKWNKVVVC